MTGRAGIVASTPLQPEDGSLRGQKPAPRTSGEAWGLVLLAAAAAVARWITRSGLIYSWDTVHYVLAQDRYSLLDHQPHPPGSLYYILLARGVRGVIGDPHAALLLLGALSGAALVVVLYPLGRELGGRAAGWLAAVIGATAPLFWFYGSVGLNYGPCGALTAAFALACVRVVLGRRGPWDVVAAGIALGVIGGLRPTDVAFLMPAYIWTLACSARGASGRRASVLGAAGSGVAFVILTCGWLVPSALNAGGFAEFWRINRELGSSVSFTSFFAAGPRMLPPALWTHFGALWGTLGAGWLLLGVFLSLWVRTRGVGAEERNSRPRTVPGWLRLEPLSPGDPLCQTSLRVLGLLVVLPAALFYLLIHFNSPGYALTYAGLLAAIGAGVGRRVIPASAPRWVLPLLLAGLAIYNTWLFQAGWGPTRDLANQRAMSWVEIRDHDRYWRELRRFLAERYPPATVRLLATGVATDGLRVAQALLPEYAEDLALPVRSRVPLPGHMARLAFFRRVTIAELAAETRPIFAVCRSRDDRAFYAALRELDLEPVPIGRGHVVLRVSVRGRQ